MSFLNIFPFLQSSALLKVKNPVISEELLSVAMNLISSFDQFDNKADSLPTVLIFLPGIHEIKLMYSLLVG